MLNRRTNPISISIAIAIATPNSQLATLNPQSADNNAPPGGDSRMARSIDGQDSLESPANSNGSSTKWNHDEQRDSIANGLNSVAISPAKKKLLLKSSRK